jgi:ferritin-like metal-binding protein YciE
MRNLSETELLSMSTLLDMENNGLVVTRAMQRLIKDDELKKQSESATLSTEGRIKGLQQFIIENRVTQTKEVH